MIGIWIEIENKEYEDINNDLFIPTIMMMSVGFIIIINSVVGLSGVLKENAALLRLVSTIMCLSVGTPKNKIFSIAPNVKLLFLGVP